MKSFPIMSDAFLPPLPPDRYQQSIIGMILTWFFTVLSWCNNHTGFLMAAASTIAAVMASIYSARASKATLRLRQKQEAELTVGHKQEPDTDP